VWQNLLLVHNFFFAGSLFHFFVVEIFSKKDSLTKTLKKMKKIITGLTVLTGLVATTAFAKSVDPNPSVLRAFQTEFKQASNVEWQERPDFAKVHFNFNGSQVEAYYEFNGELIGTARTILFDQLPLAALKAVENRFPRSAFYEVTEYSKGGELFYMLHVEQGSRKLAVKVLPSGDLSVEKKDQIVKVPYYNRNQ
jgi:hypothetical protein